MIDTTLDLRKDTSGDPDGHSLTLRRYHQLLWSKALPGGAPFDLEVAGRKGRYFLRHTSALGDFKLSSDAITTRLHRQIPRIVAQTRPEELPADPGYTIGSSLLFPKTRRSGRQTINQVRGTNRKISDRFDLTLECIRRHYLGQGSPLSETLSAYSDFFGLFEGFPGYVAFWLLDDLVEDGEVRFWLPFDDFKGGAMPTDVPSYVSYMWARDRFISARNARIAADPRARVVANNDDVDPGQTQSS
ncbi:DUF6994 family protein [Ornithinimicrobium cerasi]|nr:hypothetical protein [Ornithinimicrobium cerasi]